MKRLVRVLLVAVAAALLGGAPAASADPLGPPTPDPGWGSDGVGP